MSGIIDLYSLLVEQTSGGLGIAIIGIAIGLVVMAAISRMSMPLIITILFFYFFVCAVYFAWWSSMFIALIVFVYFFFSIAKFFSGGQ
jgi:hypothetical protein